MTSNELQRIQSFIARHQWVVLREEHTCFAPEQKTDWTAARFAHFADTAHWVFAKTMRQNPHDYTLRRTAPDHRTFDDAVLYIRTHGVIEYFQKKPYKMLESGGHKFWTMGSPLCDTLLINRKESIGDERQEQGDDRVQQGLGYWPAIQEFLPRGECFSRPAFRSPSKPIDQDDFEFFVSVIQRDGRKVKKTWYLDVHEFAYWATLLPRNTKRISRARRSPRGER